MNKLSYVLFSIIVINAILSVFFFAFFVEAQPRTQVQPFVPQINHQYRDPQKEQTQTHPLVEEVNEINSRIRTFSSDQVEAKIWTGKIRVKLRGVVKYEKSRHSRMILDSAFGTEADLGSNENIFWYWSKRDRDKSLKYARHEDHFDTGLKTGLNPDFIMMCLGLDEIKTKGSEVIDHGSTLSVIKTQFSSAEKFYHITVIDKKLKRIKGFVLSDLDNNPIITCDIVWYNGLPAKNLINWHREGQTLSMEYFKNSINRDISDNWWIVPNYQPRRNLVR